LTAAARCTPSEEGIMRKFRWFFLGIALIILLPVSLEAQGTPQSVQVVVGADGSIKVIDPKTGCEVPSVVTRTQVQPPVGVIPKEQADMIRLYYEQLQPKKEKDDAAKKAVEELDKARKQLDKLLKESKKESKKDETKKDEIRKIEVKELELEIQRGPDGEFRIIRVQRPGKAITLEQKVDRLLEEMAALRKDVNQLKGRAEGKKPELPYQQYWQQYVPGGWGRKPGESYWGREVDKATLREIEELLKKLNKPMERDPREKKTEPEKKKSSSSSSSDLERRLERLLDEAEALRREIHKSKGSKKKKDDE
jgi:hypothetical protein